MIGISILTNAILAFVSGSYALYTVFKSTGFSVLFGLLYVLIIFNLDRYIVSTTRTEKGRFWIQFAIAQVRILAATLIALVITMPLELKILEAPIMKQIAEENAISASDAQKNWMQTFQELLN